MTLSTEQKDNPQDGKIVANQRTSKTQQAKYRELLKHNNHTKPNSKMGKGLESTFLQRCTNAQ